MPRPQLQACTAVVGSDSRPCRIRKRCDSFLENYLPVWQHDIGCDHQDLAVEQILLSRGAAENCHPAARVDCQPSGDKFVGLVVAGFCAPPILELEFEMDVRGLAHEQRL